MSSKGIKLEKRDREILKIFKKNLNNIYTPRSLSSLTGYASSGISNSLSKLVKSGLIIRVSYGKYQFKFESIKNEIVLEGYEALLKYLNTDVKDTQFRRIFSDIIWNKYPLGIHRIYCHKRNVLIDYDKLSWKIVNQQNGEKQVEIPNIKEFGRTTISVWKGETNNNKPSLAIHYKGDIGTQRLYLTEETYPIWIKGVEDFLELILGFNSGIGSLYLKVMDINMDLDLSSIPEEYAEFKNVRIYQLNRTLEIYRYENKLRLGISKFTENEEIKVPESNPFKYWLKWFAGQQDKVKNVASNLSNFNTEIQKTNNTLEDLENNIIKPLKESNEDLKTNLKEFQEQNDEKIGSLKQEFDKYIKESKESLAKKLGENQDFVKNELLSNTNFLITELDPILKTVKDFRHEYDNDMTEVGKRFQSSSETMVVIGNMINTFQDKTNKLLEKLTDNRQESEKNHDELTNQILTLIKTNNDNVIDLMMQTQSKQSAINVKRDEKFDKIYEFAMKQMELEIAKHKRNKKRFRLFRKRIKN